VLSSIIFLSMILSLNIFSFTLLIVSLCTASQDTVELKEHYIKYTNEDIDKIIISDRVKDILFQRETYREAYYKKNN
jgi:hypothetical protein